MEPSHCARAVSNWNPTLPQADCFALVKVLFGIDLPGVQSLMDMEAGVSGAFFSRVVFNETQRAWEAVGDIDKVIAWVSTGRSPHTGDPMPAGDLYRILTASAEAGLKQYVCHPDDTEKFDAVSGDWRPTRYHH